MNVAVLRVEGEDAALEALKSALPVHCDTQWTRGDRRRSGATYDASGFSVTVADATNPRELQTKIASFLKLCKEKNLRFANSKTSAELAVGFTVGDSEQYVAGVVFSVPELLSLAQDGIALSITAYPTSDAANAEDSST